MKRLYNSLLVVMEQFCMLTVVPVYSHDKIAQNYAHISVCTRMHVKTGGV